MWKVCRKKKKKKENKWGRIGKNYEELLKKLQRNLKEMWKCERPDELKGPKGDDLKRFLSLQKPPRLLDHFSLFGHGVGFFVDNANCWR